MVRVRRCSNGGVVVPDPFDQQRKPPAGEEEAKQAAAEASFPANGQLLRE